MSDIHNEGHIHSGCEERPDAFSCPRCGQFIGKEPHGPGYCEPAPATPYFEVVSDDGETAEVVDRATYEALLFISEFPNRWPDGDQQAASSWDYGDPTTDEGCLSGCYWDGGVCARCGKQLRCGACGQFVTIEGLSDHIDNRCPIKWEVYEDAAA